MTTQHGTCIILLCSVVLYLILYVRTCSCTYLATSKRISLRNFISSGLSCPLIPFHHKINGCIHTCTFGRCASVIVYNYVLQAVIISTVSTAALGSFVLSLYSY